MAQHQELAACGMKAGATHKCGPGARPYFNWAFRLVSLAAGVSSTIT